MSTSTVTEARIAIPADSFDLVAALITRLGGQVMEEDGDVVTIPPIPESERVGRMLKGLRLREGLTQKTLAEALGVPQSHISAYEKNKRPIPTAKAEQLGTLLRTVPSHFLTKGA
jgi:DNA-binding XRE family transcriptional regulator